jgi:hypothetical protein
MGLPPAAKVRALYQADSRIVNSLTPEIRTQMPEISAGGRNAPDPTSDFRLSGFWLGRILPCWHRLLLALDPLVGRALPLL